MVNYGDVEWSVHCVAPRLWLDASCFAQRQTSQTQVVIREQDPELSLQPVFAAKTVGQVGINPRERRYVESVEVPQW